MISNVHAADVVCCTCTCKAKYGLFYLIVMMYDIQPKHTPLNKFVDIIKGDTDFIGTSKFNPITPPVSKNTDQM